jgi:hypothetical protein
VGISDVHYSIVATGDNLQVVNHLGRTADNSAEAVEATARDSERGASNAVLVDNNTTTWSSVSICILHGSDGSWSQANVPPCRPPQCLVHMRPMVACYELLESVEGL